MSRRSVSCVSSPTPPNCVSASSTKITTRPSENSTRRRRSKSTSVWPYHWLRMFFSVRTGTFSSAATASKMKVFPPPMGPETAAPGRASAPLERMRGISSSLRNALSLVKPTTSAMVWVGILNSTTSSPSWLEM